MNGHVGRCAPRAEIRATDRAGMRRRRDTEWRFVVFKLGGFSLI